MSTTINIQLHSTSMYQLIYIGAIIIPSHKCPTSKLNKSEINYYSAPNYIRKAILSQRQVKYSISTF